jgi:hypothetical protein
MAAKRGAKLALPGTDDPGTDASENGGHDGLPSVAGRPEPARLSIGRRSGARALLPEAKNLSHNANRAGNRGTR